MNSADLVLDPIDLSREVFRFGKAELIDQSCQSQMPAEASSWLGLTSRYRFQVFAPDFQVFLYSLEFIFKSG